MTSLTFFIQTSFAQSYVCQEHDSEINVIPTKEIFYPNENMILSVIGQPNKTTELIIENPKSTVFSETKTSTTDNATFTYLLEANPMKGTWKIIANQDANVDILFLGIYEKPQRVLTVHANALSYSKFHTATFTIAGSPEQSLSLDVFNPMKQTVFHDELVLNSNGMCVYSISLEDFSAGVYDLEISDNRVFASTTFSVGLQPYDSALGDASEFTKRDILNFTKPTAPLKQVQSGIQFNEIQCKQNLVLIQKYEGSPACVTEPTKTKLIERGWTGITIVLNDNQKEIGSYLKQVEILDENYVRISMSYPTNDAKHEIYPDDNQSIVSDCTKQNNTATLSLLYLQKIDTVQNKITLRQENKTFDGLQCDEALWQELTKWGYCGPPSSALDQDTVVSLEEANKQTGFPLMIPSFLPDGYSVQTVILRNNDRATLYISPNPVSDETGVCEFIWADEGIFMSFIKHPEILNWGSSSNFNEIPPKQRFSINDNPAITQNRWVGDRFGMPIPMRSELQLSMPENDVLISMSSSLSSDELIKIAESLEVRK